MINTKNIGEDSEIQVVSALMKIGYTVLTPVIGDNKRYDMVIEACDKFYRVQVKTARVEGGTLYFSTCSSTEHRRGGSRKDYRGQIELFAVYSPDTDKVYVMSVDEVGKAGAKLRLEPTKNNQKKNVRWAKDHELDKTSLLRYINA